MALGAGARRVDLSRGGLTQQPAGDGAAEGMVVEEGDLAVEPDGFADRPGGARHVAAREHLFLVGVVEVLRHGGDQPVATLEVPVQHALCDTGGLGDPGDLDGAVGGQVLDRGVQQSLSRRVTLPRKGTAHGTMTCDGSGRRSGGAWL